MRGLSFAAKAVTAAATALTYELQERELPARMLRNLLGLSEEAWEVIYEELYDNGTLFRVVGRCGSLEMIELQRSSEILSRAIGPAGRPTPKDWAELRERVIEEHGAACLYCEAADIPLAIDHVIPVSRGGSNHHSNLVPSCKRCNSAKGNKTWEEWSPQIAKMRP